MDWNLSFGDDEGWEEERENFLKAQQERGEEKKDEAFAEMPSFASHEEDDDEEESIDWEDADHEGDESVAVNLNTKLPAKKSDDKTPPKKKQRRRKRVRYESLPGDTQDLLQNLQNVHLLSYAVHVVYVSALCSDPNVMAVTLSLLPNSFHVSTSSLPTMTQLQDLTEWYFKRVHSVQKIREHATQRNQRRGAPRPALATRRIASLSDYADYLSPRYDQDAQLHVFHEIPEHFKAWLLVSLLRALPGCRARLVMAVDHVVRLDLDEDHPLLQQVTPEESKDKKETMSEKPLPSYWVEVLTQTTEGASRWIHVDPRQQWLDQPQLIEARGQTLMYVIAVEHRADEGAIKVSDVTPRYAKSFVACLTARGIIRSKKSLQGSATLHSKMLWWKQTLSRLSGGARGQTADQAIVLDDDAVSDHEHCEELELQASANNEAIPTSKAAFQTHPVYVIPSVLGHAEVLAPMAAIAGMFKGEVVYRRSDVSTALVARKWLYHGRKVRSDELSKPAKTVKARKKAQSKHFQTLKSYNVGAANDGSREQRQRDIEMASAPLDDGMDKLYGKWQTDPWGPDPVGPTDPIPINEYKNVELELLNPGLVHISERGVGPVAKKLCIPYAPCLVGFEGHGGNRTPCVQGIVVHEHNAVLVREAFREVALHQQQVQEENRRNAILTRWKRLMVGLLTKDRIEREYGDS